MSGGNGATERATVHCERQREWSVRRVLERQHRRQTFHFICSTIAIGRVFGLGGECGRGVNFFLKFIRILLPLLYKNFNFNLLFIKYVVSVNIYLTHLIFRKQNMLFSEYTQRFSENQMCSTPFWFQRNQMCSTPAQSVPCAKRSASLGTFAEKREQQT